MSSTRDPKARRGGKRDTTKDFFRTPYAPVASLLNRLARRDELSKLLAERHGISHEYWLEPGAGDGGIIKAANRWIVSCTSFATPLWTAVEIQPRFRPALTKLQPNVLIIDDFLNLKLSMALTPTPSFVIGNPPYSLAQEFVQQSFDLAPNIAMLLRLNWAGSQKRYEFMREYPPEIWVLSQRPSFEATKKRDSVEYAWFLWGDIARAGHFEVLPPWSEP